MNINFISFNEFNEKVKNLNLEGLVILGAGGDLNEWVDGVTNDLYDEKIITTQIPEIILETTEGRQDLVFVFGAADIDLGRLAIWKLRMYQTSWISDFVVNYADQYVS